MTKERVAFLDRVAPGWYDYPVTQPEPWAAKATRVRAFRAREKRWPRQTADDSDERMLGRWLTQQRVAAHHGELRDERREFLDLQLPGWDATGARDDAWRHAAAELGAWWEKRGLWPSRRSSDSTERRLGYWLKNRRDDARAGRLPGRRIELLDRIAPGWRDSVQDGRTPSA